jgi:hypothetical protein
MFLIFVCLCFGPGCNFYEISPDSFLAGAGKHFFFLSDSVFQWLAKGQEDSQKRAHPLSDQGLLSVF